MIRTLFLLIFLAICSIDVNAVGSESVCLMDAETGSVVYQSNMDEKNLTASICKILTAIVAIENADLFSNVVVSSSDLIEGSSVYLKVDDEVLFVDLLYGLLLRSGNDCAMAIANNTFSDYDEFIEEMNLLARKIGMTKSVFENPTGLDSDSKNYSTSYDMALLMCYCLENDTFVEISSSKTYSTYIGYQQTWYQKHQLVNSYEYAFSGKTGYTKTSGRTLITAFNKDGRTLVCVSFRLSDDYNYHTYLFEKYIDKLSNVVVVEAQTFRQELGYNYLPLLTQDIILPLSSSDDLTIKLVLKEVCNSNCGDIEIYQNGMFVYKTVIYEQKVDIDA